MLSSRQEPELDSDLSAKQRYLESLIHRDSVREILSGKGVKPDISVMRKHARLIIIMLCFIGYFSAPILIQSAASAEDMVTPLAAIYTSGSASFQDILQGGIGGAHVIFYLPDRSPHEPSLVVRLTKETSGSQTVGEVFDVPPGESYVPLEFVNGYPMLSEELSPTIELIAPGGWWIREGVTNYNLDITVYGEVAAMWGSFPGSWPTWLEPGQENARILVRDSDGDGIPNWDWRTMLPEFLGGYYRTNYVERKCGTPAEVNRGIFPQWPYIADNGSGFEQEPQVFRPPIVVDWETGRVQFVSELVSVRNQNCSYSLYSISRILPGQLNHPDFESPFAFYELSGIGDGYPNMVLRTVRTVENEESLVQKGNPETQSVRYSWRNEVGDWEWDYKVDVAGQYRYDFVTSIADGAAMIDAPPYERFPVWVVERDWPATSFVAIETGNYRSSEGIYDWSMRGVTDEYIFGWLDVPDLTMYEDIATGLRGEYRVNSDHPPQLYLSPIDNRLHLKWAKHGVWRLDEEQIIRMTNVDGDETIDVWSREKTDVTESNDETANATVVEALYVLPDHHLLHLNNRGLTLVASQYEEVLFETLPPTNHETWVAQRDQLAHYKEQRRDPTNLLAWLDEFPGQRSEISGASISNVRITEDGFRFELFVELGYRTSGSDIIGIDDLPPGNYIVEYDNNHFSYETAEPVQLEVNIDGKIGSEGVSAAPLFVRINNPSNRDLFGMKVVFSKDLEGLETGISSHSIDILSGEEVRVLVDENVGGPEISTINIYLEDEFGNEVAAEVTVTTNINDDLEFDKIFSLAKLIYLIPIALLLVLSLVTVSFFAINSRPAAEKG